MSEKLKVQDTSKDRVVVATEAQDIQLTRALIQAYGSTTSVRFVQMTSDEKPVNSLHKNGHTIVLKANPLIHSGVLDLTQPGPFAAAMKPLIDAEIAKLPASKTKLDHVVGLRREIETNTTKATTTIHCAFGFDG